jgi:hypothetical protein
VCGDAVCLCELKTEFYILYLSFLFPRVRPFNSIQKVTDTPLLKGATGRLQFEMENRRKAAEKHVAHF